jgi:periplasmic protein TonB
MRWSMWPVSIVVHVVVLTAALIAPIAADDGLPTPAPLKSLVVTTIRTVQVPPEVIPSATPLPRVSSLPSVVAPDAILPSADVPLPPVGPAVPGVPLGTGPIDLGSFGPGGAMGGPPVPPPPAEPPPPPPRIVRVGQGVREPIRIGGAPPPYPVFAREARVQGTVVLEAVINERGRIERVRVLKSQPLLDAAAIAAVQEWRYTPTLLNGVPVSVLMTITINFTLQN